MPTPTYRPYDHPGPLDAATRAALPDSVFAFARQRKEPLTSASHVRDALARFDQVEGVSEAERDLAWQNLLVAARHFGVEVSESDWRELGRFRGA